MMDKNWQDSILLIADLIPPNAIDFEKFDVEKQVKDINELGFNSQHLEVNDVTTGEAGITFFETEHALQKRSDKLKGYFESHRKYGSNDIVYFNVHWLDKNIIPVHPEWFQVYHDGSIIPITYGSGGYSCINSHFRDWAFNIIKDIGKYGVKGIFLDGPVFNSEGCYCKGCLERFEKQYGFKYTPESTKEKDIARMVLEFKHNSIAEFMQDARLALKSVKPEAIIYMNGLPLGPSTCGRDNRSAVKWQDALLAEGGFLSGNLCALPIWKPAASAKLLETEAEGKPAIVAIAGRNGPWNRYLLTPAETWIAYAMSVANGANVWYGIYDTNRNDSRMETVKEINVFLRKNERYLAGTGSVSKIALVWSRKNANYYQTTTESWDFVKERTKLTEYMKSDARKAFNGWFEVLRRSHRIFDVIDDFQIEYGELNKYELVIFPNTACMGDQECEKIKSYIENGGNVIVSYDTSLYNEHGVERENLLLKDILGIKKVCGAEYMGFDHIEVENVAATEGIDQKFIPAPFLHLNVILSDRAKAFMHYREKQPSSYCDLPDRTDFPFMILNERGKGKAVTFTGNIDATYDINKFPEFLTIMNNTLDMLSSRQILADKSLTALSVNIRKKKDAIMIHLINHSSYTDRPITKIVRLKDVELSVKMKEKPNCVKALRLEKALDFSHSDGTVNFTVPVLDEYEIVVLE